LTVNLAIVPPRVGLAVLVVIALAASGPVWLSAVRLNEANAELLHLLPAAEGTLPHCHDRNASSGSAETIAPRGWAGLVAAKQATAEGACSQALAMLAGARDPEAARLQAVNCLAAGQYDCARQALMIIGMPRSVAVWLGDIGVEQAQTGSDAVAVETFRLAEAFAPLPTVGLRQYATSLGKLGFKDEGTQVLQEAVRRDPHDAESHYALSQALSRANPDSQDALTEAEAAVNLRDYFPYHYLLGSMYMRVARLDDAAQQFQFGLTSNSFDALSALGDVATAQGYLPEAAAFYGRALTIADRPYVRERLHQVCASQQTTEQTAPAVCGKKG